MAIKSVSRIVLKRIFLRDVRICPTYRYYNRYQPDVNKKIKIKLKYKKAQ